MSGTCPRGHENPATNRYCGTCGTRLRPHPQPGAGRPTRRRRRSRRYRRRRLALVLVGVAAVAAIAFVVARAWIGRSGDAVAGDRPTSTTADASTTTSRDGGNWPGTTLPASHTDPNADCDSVLITWLEYANQPAHSFEEVVGLLGRRSPEWSAIDEAWTTFQARLETEERSQAVRAVLDVVARRCEGFADGFVPRSVPTGG